MPRGLTIADLVQQVLFAVYKVRLDVDEAVEGSFHSKTDKFQEIVMEANMALQELQKEQDWNFLRDRWEMGLAWDDGRTIQEFEIPEDVYKVCTGYGDAVRLHVPGHPMTWRQLPFEEARTGSLQRIRMYDGHGRLNAPDPRNRAFTVGDVVTFARPWLPDERGCLVETDVIRMIEPLHVCSDSCPENCPEAYSERVLTWLPDPLYLVYKTAAGRAEGDPSVSEMQQILSDKAQKMLSSMRENDSAHTVSDEWYTEPLGYTEVL